MRPDIPYVGGLIAEVIAEGIPFGLLGVGVGKPAVAGLKPLRRKHALCVSAVSYIEPRFHTPVSQLGNGDGENPRMLAFPPVTPFCEKANLRGLNVSGLSVSVHVVLLLKPACVNNSSIPL